MTVHPSLRALDHRPWPVPSSPWPIAQVWRSLLFAHWRVPPVSLRLHIPESLEIETFDGSAWLGVVPYFLIVRPRYVPPIPRVFTFPELNVRTYVRHGENAGVWFFSLDARNPVAVWTARRAFHLPYFHARMSIDESSTRVDFRSARRRGGDASFQASYAPTGEVFAAEPGSIEYFLTERYCLYAQSSRGIVRRTEVHHAPWPLQPAEAEITENSMAAAAGIELNGAPELLHFASAIDVVNWLPKRIY